MATLQHRSAPKATLKSFFQKDLPLKFLGGEICNFSLAGAVLAADHFHFVQLANTMLTDVRRDHTQTWRGRRGRKADPESVNRRRLLTARERLPPAV